MKRSVFLGVGFLLAVGILGFQRQGQTEPEPIGVAIGTFDASSGTDASLAIALKPFLKKELASSQHIIIVEESRLNDALNYISLEQSGLCNPDYCPVEPGKFLSAQKIITGTISKLGRKYSFSLSIIDVQSLRVEYEDEIACLCAEEELNGPMRQLGERARLYLETGRKPVQVNAEARTANSSIAASTAIIASQTRPVISSGQRCPSDMIFIADVQVCMDKYEFPNKQGQIPMSGVSKPDAEAHCARIGKRLPRSSEFVASCEGSTRMKFGYGTRYDKTKCKKILNSMLGRKPPAASGSFPGCTNGNGTYDMQGNLAEITSDGSIHSWGGTKAWSSCGYRESYSGPGTSYWRSYGATVGFRCAMDAQRISP